MERDANALYCVSSGSSGCQLLFQPFPAGEQKLCQLLAEEGYAVSAALWPNTGRSWGSRAPLGAEREWVQFCGKLQDKAAKHWKWKEILWFPLQRLDGYVHLYGTQPHGAVSLLLGERKAFVGWQTDQIK